MMPRIEAVVSIVLLGLLAAGCGVVPRSTQPPRTTASPKEPPSSASADPSPASPSADTSKKPSPTAEAPPAMAVSSLDKVRASLMEAYRDWEGTPYKLGGASKKGVDCSRFVNIVFDQYFNIDLPTNTKTQLNAGHGIRRAGIKTGDLIFFRTGRKTLHVGIAVNRGEFLHASTSNGVMISKLGNSYWRNRFLAARRVF